ncbi:hypothetical protein B296_00005293, partial [Ensete ventricosum]
WVAGGREPCTAARLAALPTVPISLAAPWPAATPTSLSFAIIPPLWCRSADRREGEGRVSGDLSDRWRKTGARASRTTRVGKVETNVFPHGMHACSRQI